MKLSRRRPIRDLTISTSAVSARIIRAGAFFLFGDQAVRFINDGIDKDIFRRLANRADGQLLTSGPTRE